MHKVKKAVFLIMAMVMLNSLSISQVMAWTGGEERDATLDVTASSVPNAEAYKWQSKKNVPADHSWTITFNHEVNLSEVTNENIYVTLGKDIIKDTQVSLGQDRKSIIVKPPAKGYLPGMTYSLTIGQAVQSTESEKLQQPVQMDFTIGSMVSMSDLKKTRFKTSIKDQRGTEYMLYLIPSWEKRVIDKSNPMESDFYPLGVYNGDYRFALQEKGSNEAVWQGIDLKDLTFYEQYWDQKMAYTVSGSMKKTADLFILSEVYSTNEVLTKIYTIRNGELVKLKSENDVSEDAYTLVTANRPKFIDASVLQIVRYSNQNPDFGWKYSNYKIEDNVLKANGKTIHYGENRFEEGLEVYERWTNEVHFIVQ